MKLALLYTIWSGDDMEMLSRSIKQHEPQVTDVFLFIQATSNKGEYYPINLDFNYTIWEPNLELDAKENERIKHNLMIQTVKKLGFTHFIICACDHFYTPEQFEVAKKFHQSNDIDVSLTFMRTYYKHENWYIEPMERYCMPFIHKMHPNTEITNDIDYPELVDPSVKVNTSEKIHVFALDEVLLHHYSMVRKDIKKKIMNSASINNWNEKQIKKFISEYENAKIGDKLSYFKNATICRLES